MNSFPDLLIVGAGPSGIIAAEQAASLLGLTSLIVDRRNHIGGNCYDTQFTNGQLIHQYGPHYFRTNNEEIVTYLSKFTSWHPAQYVVKAQFNNELYPLPINLTTLEKFYKSNYTSESAEALLAKERENIPNPKNSEEFVLSRVGRKLYEAFYLGYTLKQWNKHPRELDASVCGRIPVRLNRIDTYVDHKHQIMPHDGYTRMFEKMVENNKIEVCLNTGYREIKETITPRIATIYTGPIDEYFNHRLGKFPWRSLKFEFKIFPQEWIQPCVQINYPDDYDYTRTVEIKHVTQEKRRDSVISFEYPTDQGDPYYPVPAEKNHQLYQKYLVLAREETKNNKVFFLGRLAQYTCLNMDESMERAIALIPQIKESI